MPSSFNNIAHFVELNISESGMVNLTLDFPQDNHLTRVDFHILELRDWLYEMNTNVDENDEIVNICITDHSISNIVVNCIEVTTQDNYKERIYEDDDFFFKDFLELDIE